MPEPEVHTFVRFFPIHIDRISNLAENEYTRNIFLVHNCTNQQIDHWLDIENILFRGKCTIDFIDITSTNQFHKIFLYIHLHTCSKLKRPNHFRDRYHHLNIEFDYSHPSPQEVHHQTYVDALRKVSVYAINVHKNDQQNQGYMCKFEHHLSNRHHRFGMGMRVFEPCL